MYSHAEVSQGKTAKYRNYLKYPLTSAGGLAASKPLMSRPCRWLVFIPRISTVHRWICASNLPSCSGAKPQVKSEPEVGCICILQQSAAICSILSWNKELPLIWRLWEVCVRIFLHVCSLPTVAIQNWPNCVNLEQLSPETACEVEACCISGFQSQEPYAKQYPF